MAAYSWSVFVPGSDLPHTVQTDYLLAEGEAIDVDGRRWIVERVDVDDESGSLQAYCVVPNEPA